MTTGPTGLQRDRVEGYIVDRREQGEDSLVVGLLTADGSVPVYVPHARVSRKRFAGRLELFSFVRATIRPRLRCMPLLTEVEVIRDQRWLAGEVEALMATGLLALVVGRAIPDRDGPPFFGRCLELLKAAPRAPGLPPLLALLALGRGGYLPPLAGCPACGGGLDRLAWDACGRPACRGCLPHPAGSIDGPVAATLRRVLSGNPIGDPELLAAAGRIDPARVRPWLALLLADLLGFVPRGLADGRQA